MDKGASCFELLNRECEPDIWLRVFRSRDIALGATNRVDELGEVEMAVEALLGFVRVMRWVVEVAGDGQPVFMPTVAESLGCDLPGLAEVFAVDEVWYVGDDGGVFGEQVCGFCDDGVSVGLEVEDAECLEEVGDVGLEFEEDLFGYERVFAKIAQAWWGEGLWTLRFQFGVYPAGF